MKISLNEIKKLVPAAEKLDTAELIKLIGSRLVEVEGSEDWSKKYRGIYIVKVASCEPIEGTHLHLCQIEAGETLSGEPVRPTGRTRAGEPRNDGREPSVSPDSVSPVSNLAQVVCGAPNVRKGMFAVWIAPGAIVPETFGTADEFKIDSRKLRGYKSHGMLAGLDELALGDDHSGIVEVDPEMPGAKPGASFAEVFGLNDIILDIENKSLTHRPDCFGLIGFAREVAGILGVKFDFDDEAISRAGNSHFSKTSSPAISANVTPEKGTFSKSTEDSKNEVAGSTDKISIAIEDGDLCQRYSCAVLDFTDEPKSPYLTATDIFLAKAGMRGISKIVDATNVIMLKTGQPLHAFDYDKFVAVGGEKTPKILVRTAKPDEKLELLDGKTIKCDENDILITSSDVPVALAGAMGGKNTEIDENTKRIILESATFSLYHLRKTQMKHGIFSEAITRFTKGQPAAQTTAALEATISTLGARVLEIADCYPAKPEQPAITLTLDDLNSLLGTSYDANLVAKTLENVGFMVKINGQAYGSHFSKTSSPAISTNATPEGGAFSKSTGDSKNEVMSLASATFTVNPPLWRTDIAIKEDVIEEIGRLLGYDNIPLDFPTHPFIGASQDELLTLKTRLRNILSDRLGAHEVLTYSFVSKRLQNTVGEDPDDSYEIINSLSPELQRFRQSLAPSLLEKVAMNLKSGYKDFSLYEINQVTKKSLGLNAENVPEMRTHLCFVTTGDFYAAKAYLVALLNNLGLNNPIFTDFQDIKSYPYLEPVRSAEFILGHAQAGKVLRSEPVQPTGEARAIAPWGTEGQRPTDSREGNVSHGGVSPTTSCAIGEIKNNVLKSLKISETISLFELDLGDLVKNLPKTAQKSLKFTKFPSVSRDITLKVAPETAFKPVQEALERALEKKCGITKVEPVSLYQAPENASGAKSPSKNLSFKLTFASENHTLNSDEISAIMETVNQSVIDKFGAEIV